MKKIIFILLMLISTNVYASEYSAFHEEKIEETDKIEVDVERRYLFYKNVINNGGYYPVGEHLIDYPFMDENDFKYSDFTIWGNQEPFDIENREVEKKTIYNYREMKEIRYIFINYANGIGNQIIFSEIEVYVNGNKMNYEAFCTICSTGLTLKINNGVTSGEIYESIHQNGILKIDLKNYYPSSIVKIRAIIYDPSYATKTYRVTFTREDDIKDSYFVKNVSNTYRSSNPNDKYVDEISYDNMILINPQYYETIYSEEYIESTIDREVTPVDLYRYKDKLFNYYGYTPVYSNEYMTSPTEEYPLIDLNQYKDYYRYKEKDIPIIEQPIEEIPIESVPIEVPIVEEPIVEELLKPVVPIKVSKPIVNKSEEVAPIIEEPIKEIIVEDKIETSNSNIKVNNTIFKNIFIPFVGALILLILLYIKREYKNIKL